MQRSGSQKVLLVLSIISVVVAILGIIASLMMMLGGSVFGMVDAQTANEALQGSGITQAEAGVAFGIVGLIGVLAYVVQLIVGILGVRAANDNQKIMPVWVLALLQVILQVVSAAMTLMGGVGMNAIVTTCVYVLIAVLVFWIANNIKREAGK